MRNRNLHILGTSADNYLPTNGKSRNLTGKNNNVFHVHTYQQARNDEYFRLLMGD